MDDLFEGLLSVVVGVGVIAFVAPLAVAGAAGAVAITAGGMSTVVAVDLGVAACGIAESSTYALGGKIISDSINK